MNSGPLHWWNEAEIFMAIPIGSFNHFWGTVGIVDDEKLKIIIK
jgi:hypothetical protein